MAKNSDADRLYDLVEDIAVCMLTSKNGTALRARPMHARLDMLEAMLLAAQQSLAGGPRP